MNVLSSLHHQTEAEFQAWAETEIVQTFGQPQAEYAAIRKSAAMIDLPQRGILELTGKDRLPFLNNLLTNQTFDKSKKSGLQAGQGIYAFVLNLRGRIVVDLNVIELGERTLLEMESRFVEPFRQLLEKYLFSEQVKLANRVDQLHEIALHGPAAAEIVGVTIPQELYSSQTRLFDVEVIVWRDDPTGEPGYRLIVPTESAEKIWTGFLQQQRRPIGWAAFNAARIEAGRPILGIDFDAASIASAAPRSKDDTPGGALPAETGLFDRAVSVTKGCYLGQEIVARMHARGQVARQLAGIRMNDDALPIAGAEVLDEQSNTIGFVTSSTMSPMLSNAAICLGVVKRPFFEIGTKVRIAAEGAIREGVVVQRPFVKKD